MTQIEIDDTKSIVRKYKLRVAGAQNATIEVSVPREAVEREARRLGVDERQMIEKMIAVWRFDSFRGLHLDFEVLDRTCVECVHWAGRCMKGYATRREEKTVACREFLERR